MLTSAQRKQLKALAHPKKPIVQVGQKGVTDPVCKEIERALWDHELIKVQLPPSDDLGADGAALAERVGCELVSVLGRNATLYRAHPEDPRIRLQD